MDLPPETTIPRPSGFNGEGPDLQIVVREMLHEQIFDALKRNLMMGRFYPGQKLPLRTLAKMLGTSLMPVRDALQRLESMGCLIATSNRTMMVPVLSEKEFIDVRKLRIVLEGMAATHAVANRSEDDLLTLKKCCKDIKRSAENSDLDLFLEANYLFHMTIAEASRLSFLTAILEPLWMRIGPIVRQSKPGPEHIRKAVKYHKMTYDAIVKRDVNGAIEALQQDIIECNNEDIIPAPG